MTELSKDERVKQQIREAALGLFAKWGLAKTTMEDIAKASGKGKSTIYYYFKSKDDIFIDIAVWEFQAIFSTAQAAIAFHTTAEERLRAYVLCTIEEVQKRATAYEIVFSEITSIETVMTQLRKKYDGEEQAVISKILSDGIASGELNPLSDQELADLSHLMLLSFKSFLVEKASKNDFAGVDKMITFAISIFMRGLKA